VRLGSDAGEFTRTPRRLTHAGLLWATQYGRCLSPSRARRGPWTTALSFLLFASTFEERGARPQASAGSTIYLWASEVFPTRVRFAAVGLAYNLSIGVFGGCAPLICQVMDAHMSLFPGYYITFLCAVSLVTCAYAHHLNATGTMVMAHMRPELY